MHRTNEANLNSITDNLEKLRECFGKWVNLSIESESRVIVTSEETSIFKMGSREIKLGELIDAYFMPNTGFKARRALFAKEDYSPYDQISRYGEWDTSDKCEIEIL